jgi:hypothetical protein
MDCKPSIHFVGIDQNADPSISLLERLRKKGFRVAPISQSLMKDGVVQDKTSGATGLRLNVYEIQCSSLENCTAKGSIYGSIDDMAGWKYRLIKEKGKWKVKDFELFIES